MTDVLFAFDVLLAAGLVWLAWRALASDDLFTSVVLFIAFGLFMALAWVRLRAPDIALAEAAIGAGLTGALFLSAVGRLSVAAGAPRSGFPKERDRHGTISDDDQTDGPW